MKKLTLLFAALVLSFTAQAVTHNVSSSFSWWVAGSDSPVQAGDTLLVTDGEYVEQWSIDFQKSDLVVMAAEGAKPVIKASSYLKIHATTTFEGITFDGLNTATYAIGSRGTEEKNLTLKNCEFKNYVDCDINIYESTSINKLTIDSCVFDGTNTTPIAIYGKGSTSELTITNSEFKNYTEYCITANDYYKGYFEKVSISNSLFHDSKYSAIYLYQATEGNPQSCTDFQLINSTIYNIGNNPTETDLPKRAVVDIRGNSTQQVLVDHVTIYNFPVPDHCGAIKIENSSNATISNCIVMNPDDIYTKWITPFLAYAGATISNSVYYNCNITNSATATQEDLTQADPMFVDAANGNFQLYAESPAIGLGDPRWGVKAGIQPGEGKLKAAVDAAQPGATIVLGDETYEVSSSIDFDVEGLTIKAAEGTKPIIKTTDQWTELKISASTTFEGITFDGGDLTKVSVSTFGTTTQTLTLKNCEFKNYTDCNVNIASETSINTIAIENCVFDGGASTPNAIYSKGIATTCTIEDTEFKNYTTHCISAGDYYRGRFDNLSINNCLFHDSPVAVYMPKYADEGDIQTCANFSLTNSTIYNMVGSEWKAVIDLRSNPEAEEALNKVVIDHITLYNFTTTELGGITSRKSTDAKITNSIIANPADNTNQYAYRVYGAAAVQNTLCFNTKRSGGNSSNPLDVDPLFVDAANGNFDLYANSPAVNAGTDGKTLGDPRWDVSEKTISTGKRINVTPDQASSLPWIIQSDESNVKAGDTIVLAAGTYELSSFELRKEGLVIMAAENAEVTIATKEGEYLKLVATTTFDGITFDGSNVANYAIRSIGTSAKNLIVRNCKFTQYARYNIYGANDTHMDSLVVDNCIFSNSGAAIYFPASNLADNVPGCSYAKVTNSTLYNIILNDYVASIDIQENNNAKQTGNTEVVIDHVTIYNFSSTAQAAIKVYKSGNTKVTNTIVANPAESEMKSFMIYDGAKVQNCLNFNSVGQWASNAYTDTICTDPLFVDAANNNFKLKGNSPAIGKATDGSNLGDPRWGVEAIVIGEGDNTAALATQGTALVQVNREFSADALYTLALPFTLTDVVSIFGQGTIVYEYDKLLEQNGEVVLHFKEVNTISAGKPYLLIPAQNVNGFVVNNVTLSNSAQTLSFTVGTITIAMEPVLSVTSDQTTDGKYWLASDTYLYNNPNALPSLRALFTISTPSSIAPRARVALGENVETGLDNNQLPNTNIQKVLENGQLIIIRDGVKYNVQGQVIK